MNVAAQPDPQSKAYYNSLITLRKFAAYCVHLGNTTDEFCPCVLPLMPVAFTSLSLAIDDTASSDGEGEVDTAIRAVQTEIVKGFRYSTAGISVACMLGYAEHGSRDVDGVVDSLDVMKDDGVWHVRQAVAHFLRCFQGGEVFLFGASQEESVRKTVLGLLADDRSEVSTAAMSTLTGIVAATDASVVGRLVTKYAKMASRSKQPRKTKTRGTATMTTTTKVEQLRTSGEVRGGGDSGPVVETAVTLQEKEERRAHDQWTLMFLLCATILAHPYDTPGYVPIALAAVSKHSFEKSAPLGVGQIVKKCCGEYKKMHMSDNCGVHRKTFSQEQLEALEDVVSTPHYYALSRGTIRKTLLVEC